MIRIVGVLLAAASLQERWAWIEQSPEWVSVKTAAGEILRYQVVRPADSKLAVESGCYFHPLATPKGVPVTDVAPDDHPHHRGVFLAWVEMRGAKDADFWGWGQHAPVKGRKIVNRTIHHGIQNTPDKTPILIAQNEWVAEETVLIREHLQALVRKHPSATVVDLHYALTAEGELTLSRWAFSGFCLRTRKDGKIEAHGPEGAVHLPAPKHTDPKTDWPAADWYGYTLRLNDGTVAGAAVLDHPSNPPALWYNAPGAGMLNPCIVAPGKVVLKAGERLELRYRVVAHDGPTPRELLNELAREWRK